jgi:hypothetical protein
MATANWSRVMSVSRSSRAAVVIRQRVRYVSGGSPTRAVNRRVQCAQPDLVESVDHIPHGVLMRRDQAGSPVPVGPTPTP